MCVQMVHHISISQDQLHREEKQLLREKEEDLMEENRPREPEEHQNQLELRSMN